MRFTSPASTAVLSFSLLLAACSSDPSSTQAETDPLNGTNETAAVSAPSNSAATPTSLPGPVLSSERADAATKVIELAGLGELQIGRAPPRDGRWAARGAQIEGSCRTISSPAYPGVYAIVTDGLVRRISVGQRSDVTLLGGVGVGSSEQAVNDGFPGFREEPHKYEEAPAKYLTTPNANSGESAVRFEIGRDRKVKLFHVGTMPVLAYVEGCA